MCLFKFSVSGNDLLQIEKTLDFSPLQILMCFFKVPASENDLLQTASKAFLLYESSSDF